MGLISECYLCGSHDFDTVRGTVRDKPELSIRRCGDCGLVFLASFEHIQEGVYENSDMHKGGVDIDIAAWMRETAGDDQRRFNYCLPFVSGKRVLDFGCGPGGFLICLRSIAQTVMGVDLENALVPHFREHGIPFSQSLEEVEGPFDVITLFHVLEHLKDPMATLLKLKDLLAPGGQILIEVPNANDALLQLYKCEAFSNFTYWSFHLFMYTSETLARLFRRIGASIRYIKHIQRYPFSNHLYWLAKQKPKGHQEWSFLDSPILCEEYERQLASIGMTDTLMASISFPKE